MVKKFKTTAIIIILLSFVLKFSGFIRESVIAKQFGASHLTDGYLLAFTLITLVLIIISTGFNNVFLPLYTKNKKLDSVDNERNANALMNSTILIFILLGVIGFFAIPYLAPLLFGYIDAETRHVAVKIAQFFAVFLPFLALNSILESYLQARYSFVPAHVSKLSATLFSALFGLYFADSWGIMSFAYGFVFGLIIGVIIQIIYLCKNGFHWTPTLRLNSHFKKAFFVLLIPALMNAVVGPINAFADKLFASSTIGGAVTYLNNASLLVSIPNAIYATTIGAIVFTFLTESMEDKENFNSVLTTGIRVNFMIFIPLTAGLMLVGNQAIAFIYQHGAFTTQDTFKTYQSLLLYGPLIITQGMQVIISKALYALEKTKALFRFSLTTILLNLLFNYLFMMWFGFLGLALSSSLVSVYYLIITTRFLSKEAGVNQMRDIILPLASVLLPTLIMIIPMFLVQIYPPVRHMIPFVQILLLTVTGLLFYFLGTFLFNRSGLVMLYRIILKSK